MMKAVSYLVMGVPLTSQRYRLIAGETDGGIKVKLDSDEDFPVRMERIFDGTIVGPHRHLLHTWTINGDAWKKELFPNFNPDSKQSIPIEFICKVSYKDTQGCRYLLNASYELIWLKANNISKLKRLDRSREKDPPIRVITKEYIKYVMATQGIDPNMIEVEEKLASSSVTFHDFRSGVQVNTPSVTH